MRRVQGRSRSGDRIREVVVVVPARDEEELIGRCLRSLVVARNRLRRSRPRTRVRLIVVADSCRDATPEIVREWSGAGIELVVSTAGRVGRARSVGVARAIASRSAVAMESCWIASTDADSAVPPNWLVHQIELAESGADVVVGTVRPDPADLTADQEAAWRSTHTPGRPNGHVHGANLGIRAITYRVAGGFEGVAEHEDNLLIGRVRLDGALVVASDIAEVLTSGRRIGRTPGGYAAYLEQSLGPDPRDLEPEGAP